MSRLVLPPATGLERAWGALRRSTVLIVVLALLGAVVGGVIGTVMPRTYSVTTEVQVDPVAVDDSSRALEALAADTSTEPGVAASTLVLDRALTELPGWTLADLRSAVEASKPAGSVITSITAEASTAGEARAVASAVADAYLAERGEIAQDKLDARRKQIETDLTALSRKTDSVSAAQAKALTGQLAALPTVTQPTGTVLTPASEAPAWPSASRTRDAALGLLLGLLVGGLVALCRPWWSRRLRSAQEVAALTLAPAWSVSPERADLASAAELVAGEVDTHHTSVPRPSDRHGLALIDLAGASAPALAEHLQEATGRPVTALENTAPGSAPDAQALHAARGARAVVLLVAAGTARSEVTTWVDEIESLGAPLVGTIVLTSAPGSAGTAARSRRAR